MIKIECDSCGKPIKDQSYSRPVGNEHRHKYDSISLESEKEDPQNLIRVTISWEGTRDFCLDCAIELVKRYFITRC